MIKKLVTLIKKEEFSPNWVHYFGVLVFLLIMNSQKVINAYVTGKIVDGVIKMNIRVVILASLIGLGYWFVVLISKYFERVVTTILQETMNLNIRANIFQRIHYTRLNDLEHLTPGDAQQLFLTDVEETTSIYFAKFFSLLVPFIMAVISFLYLATIDVNVAVLVIIVSPILGYAFEKLRLKMREVTGAVREAEVEYRNFLQNIIEGTKNIINYQKEYRFYRKSSKNQRILKKSNLKIAKVQGFGYGTALFFVYTVQLIAIYLGFLDVQQGKLTIGELVSVMTLVGNVVAGFSDFGRNYAEMQKSLISAEKVLNFIEIFNKKSNPHPQTTGDSVIEIKNVHFSYSDQSILEDANLIVKSGDTILLRAPNGGGKSTIFKLILGLFESQNGEIRVNDNIKWLPTDDYLFSCSIYENIFWEIKKEITEDTSDRYQSYCKKFGLKFDLEQEVNINGLSGGEKQKLKIIRCFHETADIYLLDEPTKALDGKSREKLREIIKEELKEKTVLIIDHTRYFDDIVNKIYEISDKRITTTVANEDAKEILEFA